MGPLFLATIASATPLIHSRVSRPRDPSRPASRPRDRHPEIARALAEHLLQDEVAWKARRRGLQLKRPTPMPATCCNRPALRHWVRSFSRLGSEPPLHPPGRRPQPPATLRNAVRGPIHPGPLQLGPPRRIGDPGSFTRSPGPQPPAGCHGDGRISPGRPPEAAGRRCRR